MTIGHQDLAFLPDVKPTFALFIMICHHNYFFPRDRKKSSLAFYVEKSGQTNQQQQASRNRAVSIAISNGTSLPDSLSCIGQYLHIILLSSFNVQFYQLNTEIDFQGALTRYCRLDVLNKGKLLSHSFMVGINLKEETEVSKLSVIY